MNANHSRRAAALILSPDPMAAALLGAALEIAGLAPVYPLAGEAPRDAARRLRPSHVLIDCDDASADDTTFIGPATMMGARVLLFGSATRIPLRQHVAIRLHLGVVVLPADATRLASILMLPAPRAPSETLT